ncbi:MAG: Gfo/Idh/MocA family oxidoreductase [Thermoleophilaceae bacterium]|nr:Gfo/Idh/MocA family oxidoreductase [Thermoleophilaceae bacterium]
MTDRRLNVAVVGLGYWGPNRLRVLVDNDEAAVTHICDLDAERLTRFAQRHPTTNASPHFDDLLEDDGLDAILLATPVFTHYALAKKALEAGKHLFVEKPLAGSSCEAAKLVLLAAERELVLRCGHTFLFSPAVRAIKDLLDRGELGELYFVSSSRVNLGLHQQDMSVVWDLGPHDFSLLLYLLDQRPTWVSANGRDSIVKGVPDVAFLDLGFDSGLLANIELSWLAPSKLRRTVIVGSEKMVLYDDSSREPVRVFDQGVVYEDPESFGQYQLSYRTGDIVTPRIDTGEPIDLEMRAFFHDIAQFKIADRSLDIATDVVQLIESAESSMENQGEKTVIPASLGRERRATRASD